MRIIPLLLMLLLSTIGTAQVVPSIGYQIGFVNVNGQQYDYTLATQNENRTIDSYHVRSKMNPLTHGVNIRSYGGQFLSKKEFTVGYSLGLNYMRFTSSSNLIFLESSTKNSDSIINAYNGFNFETAYHALSFINYIDVNWNVSDNVKITNSLGLGISAIVNARTPKTNFDGAILNTNHPLLRFSYQLQVTEEYKRISIGYFVNVNLKSVNLFVDKNQLITDKRMDYADVRLNGIGIRIIPKPKRKNNLINE